MKTGRLRATAPRSRGHPREGIGARSTGADFHERVTALFKAHFRRLYRYLDRMSGEPELAADLAQEAFVRLYRRGSLPDAPEAWLITVALNLFRNARSTQRRRHRLLSLAGGELAHSDPLAPADREAAAEDSGARVRAAMERLPERDRQLLLLRAEDYSYRDLARALNLNEASIGTLLARARRAFRNAYGSAPNAS